RSRNRLGVVPRPVAACAGIGAGTRFAVRDWNASASPRCESPSLAPPLAPAPRSVAGQGDQPGHGPGWTCRRIGGRKCRFSLRNPPLPKLHDDSGTLYPRRITAVLDTLLPDSFRYCAAPRFARRKAALALFASLLE